MLKRENLCIKPMDHTPCLKRRHDELASEIRDEIKALEKRLGETRARQNELLALAETTKGKIVRAKKRLKELPFKLYSETAEEARKIEIPVIALELILWYYVRYRSERYDVGMFASAVDISLYCRLHPSTIATTRVLEFPKFVARHRNKQLIQEAARWTCPFANIMYRPNDWPPEWKTPFVSGSTLEEALRKIKPITLKAHHVTATIFGPDGLVVFKCKHAAEVMHRSTKRRLTGNEYHSYYTLFNEKLRVALLPDGSGFRIPYHTRLRCWCNWPSRVCSRCKPTFYINKRSKRLYVACLG